MIQQSPSEPLELVTLPRASASAHLTQRELIRALIERGVRPVMVLNETEYFEPKQVNAVASELTRKKLADRDKKK